MTNALEPLDDVVDLPHVHVPAAPLRLSGARAGGRATGLMCIYIYAYNDQEQAGDVIDTDADWLRYRSADPTNGGEEMKERKQSKGGFCFS